MNYEEINGVGPTRYIVFTVMKSRKLGVKRLKSSVAVFKRGVVRCINNRKISLFVVDDD